MKDPVIDLVVEICVKNYLLMKNEQTIFDSIEKFFMSLAQTIKQTLDQQQESGNKWQVITGLNYGSFVTHESFYFVHFSYDNVFFTVFISS